MRDALFDLPTERFWVYLAKVYERMAREVPRDALVAEVGARVYRGVMTPEFIHCRAFTAIDRNPGRPGWTADVLRAPVHADVILSTCILHHTPEASIPRLLRNLRAPLLMFSGPALDTHEPYGDHACHLQPELMRERLAPLGYTMTWERFGLTEPYCEAIIIARRSA